MGILEKIGLFESAEKKLKIYVDLDGVLCDWEKAFENLGKEFTKGLKGQDYEDTYGRDALWALIAKEGKLEFWGEMPWMQDGKELWEYIKKFNPTVLSTPANSKFSKEGKKIWLARELGKNVPFIFSKDKFEHANPESILIDDYEKKYKNWIAHGGIGILHKSASQTIAELKKLGL
jgi:FMN phosphatase YigB (HAD superfamily)